jgi:hypothetical protein
VIGMNLAVWIGGVLTGIGIGMLISCRFNRKR